MTKKSLIVLSIIIVVICMISFVVHAEEPTTVYQFTIQKNENSDEFQIELSEKHIKESNIYSSVNFDNMDFGNIGVNTVFNHHCSTDEELYQYIRITCLEQGYAKLIDESIAKKEEINAQNTAQKKQLGIWSSEYLKEYPDEDKETANESNKRWEDFFKQVKSILNENWIINLLGLIPFSAIVLLIINSIRKKQKVLFIAGDKSTGKTTMFTAITDPQISEEELKSNAMPSRITKRKLYIRDNNNRKFPLYVNIVDYPGDENNVIIDTLSSSPLRKLKKYCIVILLSPTPKNEKVYSIDKAYVDDQKYTFQKLWSGIIKSKKIIKPKHIYIYLNKTDLLTNVNFKSVFKEHIDIIKTACLHQGIKVTVIEGAVTKRIGISRIINDIKEM